MTVPLTEALAGDPIEAAKALLGAELRRGPVRIMITEVEAYAGSDDPAAHAFAGPTARNSVLFGPAGHLYVYLSYGLHHAANISCGPVGYGGCVLLRAGQVIEGSIVVQQRRGPRTAERDLARGPGRLAQALALTREHNGDAVLGPDVPAGGVMIIPAGRVSTIASGPRVGITRATDRPWRFWIADHRYVSAFRPGRPRAR